MLVHRWLLWGDKFSRRRKEGSRCVENASLNGAQPADNRNGCWRGVGGLVVDG